MYLVCIGDECGELNEHIALCPDMSTVKEILPVIRENIKQRCYGHMRNIYINVYEMEVGTIYGKDKFPKMTCYGMQSP